MRDQLVQYVNLLFAGTRDCQDIRQEILQNTLDRYDDLIAEGKVPEAAYRLAISGIGDINEILGSVPAAPAGSPADGDTPQKKRMRAIAVALYILCPVPLLILAAMGGDLLAVVGVCILLGFVALATVLMVLGAVKEEQEKPENPLVKSLNGLIWAVAVMVYLAVSFLTQAWSITWLIFLIAAAATELVEAIIDLKEVQRHEN